MTVIEIDCRVSKAPTRNQRAGHQQPRELPEPISSQKHPKKQVDNNNASLYFVGTATTMIEWQGFRLMTDPNFLHAGDHVHLGPGVTGTRRTDPAVNIEDLPQIDAVLLSHYHADHFDQVVEESLRRDLPIITTPHAESHLANKGSDSFTNVHALDFWQASTLSITPPPTHSCSGKPQMVITGMPGTHVPPGPLSVANDLLSAVPPTNGWMVELSYVLPGKDLRGAGQQITTSASSTQGNGPDESPANPSYRIYITGDTLMFDELHRIPEIYSANTGKAIDLMLIHLGGTTIPSPKLPLLMVTMDAKQGVEMLKLMDADITIPIHFDDYDVFLSPLSDFQKAVDDLGAEWRDRVVYLERGCEYRFEVPKPKDLQVGEPLGKDDDVRDVKEKPLLDQVVMVKNLYPGGSSG